MAWYKVPSIVAGGDEAKGATDKQPRRVTEMLRMQRADGDLVSLEVAFRAIATRYEGTWTCHMRNTGRSKRGKGVFQLSRP